MALSLGLVSTASSVETIPEDQIEADRAGARPDDYIDPGKIPVAPGSETRSGRLVEVTETELIPGDLIVACKTLRMNGKVRGDLLAGGMYLNVGDTVGRDLVMGGYNIEVSGTVGEAARMIGINIVIDGTINGELVAFGGNVNIAGDVKGDVIIGGGKVNISGNIQGSLDARCGEMIIDGTIGQNVVLTASSLTLSPTAVLKGNLTYTSKRAAEIEEGAQIAGEIRMEPGGTMMFLWKLTGMAAHRLPEQPEKWREWKARCPVWFRTLLAISSFVSLLGAGVIILSLYRRHAIIVADRIVSFPLKCLWRGLVFLIGVPVISLILCATIAALPLGLVALSIYLAFSYISRVYIALAIGREILDRITKQEIRIIWPMILGLFIITALSHIPYQVGCVVNLIFVLFGLGGMLMTGKRIRMAPREETT